MSAEAPAPLPPAGEARDLMTFPVITAPPDADVRTLAGLMFKHNLGALPIVEANGAPVGMVSDGDLFGRRPEDKRRAWWLGMLARDLAAPDLPEWETKRTARDVMSAPLVTVAPSTPVSTIAEMLQLQHLKRLPVIEGGKIVGIVSRTDLLRVVKALPKEPEPSAADKFLEFMESLIGGASLRGVNEAHNGEHAPVLPEAPPITTPEDFSASALRDRVRAFKNEKVSLREAQSVSTRRDRQLKVKALLDQHLSAQMWRSLIEHARVAAEQGEREMLILQFPSDLCADGGRMIDVAEAGWETTLRGEPAELYARWRDELRPQGFRLSARVASYDSEGVIGDIGLYLLWGE